VRSLVILAAAMVFGTPALAGRHQVTAEQAAQFRPGVATYADVVGKLGKQTSISSDSDGQRVVVYTTIHARPKAVDFVPFVGLFAGGATGETYIAVFVFGPDGRLKRSNATEANSDCSANVFSVGCHGGGMAPDVQAATAQAVAPAVPVAVPAAPVVAPAPSQARAAPALAVIAPVKVPPRRGCLRVATDPSQDSC
jgi:hypothetical protein